nr:40S ribosomal protein S19-3-like isoform X2 [Ziziphus jujuba var. spinosa]
MEAARTVKDVSPHEFVKAYAAHLKRSGRLICLVASIARKIYLRGGLGVGSFQRIYGGSKRNGSRPPHFHKRSGSVACHILQQLESMNIIDWKENHIQWPAGS